jgi:DNA-binding GntR family transcriptional regulator
VDDLGIELDRLAPTPLWQQLADALRARILDGTIPANRKLPTEQALADRHDIGRSSTAARALATLREEGLVIHVPGRGSFSAPADVIAKIKRGRKT